MCEVNVDTIRRAHKICPVTAIQSEYHLMHRMVETNGVLELCEDLGIGFVPYSPLNRGFLGGMINEYTKFDVTNDNRQTLPRFQPEAIRANYRIVEVLNAFGRTRGITPAQIALAWLMNKKLLSCLFRHHQTLSSGREPSCLRHPFHGRRDRRTGNSRSCHSCGG